MSPSPAGKGRLSDDEEVTKKRVGGDKTVGVWFISHSALSKGGWLPVEPGTRNEGAAIIAKAVSGERAVTRKRRGEGSEGVS
ncbi:hypothetical protein CTA1_11822 [Colletotrichum tanaceti]|uniref:Uncharacterized protein n=1 Tax=Colletotrichum tanaceti TaxID=1306861 RepID=A0A4U6X5U0_9PEZI|nr:hypothetical protein CTA1_11822 [Colletotrichum tanaceti]